MVLAEPGGHLSRGRARVALVEVAAQLLRDGGPAAVTTRAVAAAAGVQAPTIYRLFGDKDGLLDAVAEHALATYVSTKTLDVEADPIVALRAGWDLHVEFGLANPALFALLAEPSRASSPATAAGLDVLAARVHRIAAAGRLRVAERHAVRLLHAAGIGTVLTLIATPAEDREPGLAEAMYAAVMAAILTGPPDASTRPEPAEAGPVSAAVTLRAAAADLQVLSSAERAMLAEWLDRVVTRDLRSGRGGTG